MGLGGGVLPRGGSCVHGGRGAWAQIGDVGGPQGVPPFPVFLSKQSESVNEVLSVCPDSGELDALSSKSLPWTDWLCAFDPWGCRPVIWTGVTSDLLGLCGNICPARLLKGLNPGCEP